MQSRVTKVSMRPVKKDLKTREQQRLVDIARWVTQRLADGFIAVIGHGGENTLSDPHEDKTVHLEETVQVGNAPVGSQ